MSEEINLILEYKGNDESFKKYNEELEKSIDFETVYYDEEKKLNNIQGKW